VTPAANAAGGEFVARLRKRFAFSFDLARLARPFDGPAPFLLGRQDNVCGYADAWSVIESYPRATFAVLDRAGHWLGPGMEQEALYLALGSEWLDCVEAEAPPRPPMGGDVRRA
jgi:hypothetical protein